MKLNKVLIVEDDSSLLIGLKDNFKLAGYEVATATNGTAGLNRALELKPNLIILDLMLPEMNGYEVCQAIREEGLAIPIIMLTVKSQESDIVLGLKLGADDYVTKPFSIRELLARAETILRRCQNKESACYFFGDCVLDKVSQVLTRKEKEVKLSPKEYKLLQFFLSRPNHALTRDEILNNVWGYNQYVTSRTVDRFVTTLRKKIEPNPRNPTYIITIRETGYRFCLDKKNNPPIKKK